MEIRKVYTPRLCFLHEYSLLIYLKNSLKVRKLQDVLKIHFDVLKRVGDIRYSPCRSSDIHMKIRSRMKPSTSESYNTSPTGLHFYIGIDISAETYHSVSKQNTHHHLSLMTLV